nr:cold-inducible protein YdjO-related protein [Ammoniphilus oxalaticus]
MIKPPQEGELLPTETWECVSDLCNGWMRKEYSFDSSPACPLCQSHMSSGTRMIPELSRIFRKSGIRFGRGNPH